MKLKLSLLSICITSILAGCGGSSSDDSNKNSGSHNTNIPIAPETVNISIDTLEGRIAIPIQFTDANTGEPIKQKIVLTASDNLSNANVYESTNLGVNAATTLGSSTIFLKADQVKTATKDKPIKLRLIASAEGYFVSSIDIIYDGTPPTVRNVTLVKVSDPPSGIAVAEQPNVTANKDGILQVPIQLTAKTNANDPLHQGVGGTFSLPAGTILKDHAGNLLTGDLKVTIGYFSPNTHNIENVFPGGLSPDYVRIWENGQWTNQTGTFITAGLLAVDIVDSQGRKAHIFGDGQTATMAIETPSGLINPQTNQPIKEGDTIPVWSHNEVNGLWQRELIGTFKKNDVGTFTVTYTVKHLSYWNLDWKTDSCTAIPATFSKPFYSSDGISVTARMDNYGHIFTTNIFNDKEELGFYLAPNNKKITFEARDHNGKLLGTGVKAADGTCNGVVIELNEQFLTNNPPAEYCPNPVNVKFSKPFYSAGYNALYGNKHIYYTSLRESTQQKISGIPKDRPFALKLLGFNGSNYDDTIGIGEKTLNTCDDIIINMDENFVTNNPPLEYCPNPITVNFSKQFFLNESNNRVSSYIENQFWNSIHFSRYQKSIEFTKIPKNRTMTFELVGTGIQVKKPLDSCSNVTLNTDTLPSSSRQVIIKPTIRLNEELSYDDVVSLIGNMSSLSEQTRKEILDYTHPDGTNSSFILNNDSYQVLMNRWLTRGQIASLQALQAVQIPLPYIITSYSFPIINSQGKQQYIYGYSSNIINANGEVIVQLPAGIDLNEVQFITDGYINNKYIWSNATVNIPANIHSLNVPFSNIPAIRAGINYLKDKCANGIPSNDPNAKYCGVLK